MVESLERVPTMKTTYGDVATEIKLWDNAAHCLTAETLKAVLEDLELQCMGGNFLPWAKLQKVYDKLPLELE